jgi:hypothetical protein
MYERAALILDGENHPLGGLSLALIALGLRPLYAAELDELVLLSREYRSQVGALLLPSEELPAWLPSVRKQVLEPLGLALSNVIPVGNRIAPELAAALRDEGVRYCLPAEPEPHELRHVVARAISDSDPGELRRDPRVPCEIPTSIESEHRTVEGRLTDLSLGGAFVSLAHPFARETEIQLDFALGSHRAVLLARVRWCVDPRSPAWRDRGVGVEFVEVDRTTAAALRRFVDAKTNRFRF